MTTSNFKLSARSEARIEDIDIRLKLVIRRALEITPIDFGIPRDGGKRTTERQSELFHDNKSKCDGYRLKSYHQSGRAFDVYAYVDGTASWEKEHLAIVAAAILQAANELEIKLEWGGLWKSFVDMPHFQLPKP